MFKTRTGDKVIDIKRSQNLHPNDEVQYIVVFFLLFAGLIWTLSFADRSMHRLYFGTIFLNFLSLCPRLSFTVNNTDPRWAAIGEQVKLNVTSEENTTDIPRIKHELHIGGLFDLDSRNGVGALSAAMLAVEEINKDSRYLEDYQIVLHHQRSTEVGNIFIVYFLFLRKAGGLQI